MCKSKTFICVIIVFAILYQIEATLSPKTNKESKTKTKTILSGPKDKSVVELNLVTTNPSANDIIKNNKAYSKNTDRHNVTGISLGYVTPWNNHGYDIAKTFANKFTHISPVWLQVKRKGSHSYEITGTHDIDKKWMKDVVTAGRQRQVKIVPRVILEGWTSDDYNAIFNNIDEAGALAQTFENVCTSWKFNGFVLEGFSQVFIQVHAQIVADVVNLIALRLTNVGCETILVLPALSHNDILNMYIQAVFEKLYDVVTAFSLMTYDYSTVQKPGPNSPIDWVNATIRYLGHDKIKRKKILTGLNFYGNAYTPNGGGTIVANRYLELLKSLKGKVKYDPRSAENFFEVQDSEGRFLVFYPTLYSINERIKLIKELGTGMSIWELGQGLDYFYDLI